MSNCSADPTVVYLAKLQELITTGVPYYPLMVCKEKVQLSIFFNKKQYGGLVDTIENEKKLIKGVHGIACYAIELMKKFKIIIVAVVIISVFAVFYKSVFLKKEFLYVSSGGFAGGARICYLYSNNTLIYQKSDWYYDIKKDKGDDVETVFKVKLSKEDREEIKKVLLEIQSLKPSLEEGFVGADIHIMEVKIDNQIYASYALSNLEDPIQSLHALISKHYFENVDTVRLEKVPENHAQ